MKIQTQKLIGALVLLALSAPNLQLSTALAQTLIDRYPLTETSGAVAHDSVGGHNGILSGDAAFASGGINAGDALSVNNSTNTGFVSLGTFFNPSGDFSVVAWINTTQTNGASAVGNNQQGVDNGFILGVNNIFPGAPVGDNWGKTGNAVFEATQHPFSSDSGATSTTTSVNDGNWHQVVGIYQASGLNEVAVDGTIQGTVPSVPYANPNNYLVIGGLDNNANNPDGSFTGLIDDVQIYNGALSASQVQYLYNHPGQTLPSANFSDTFNPPSALWNNASGNWTNSGADYYAQQPNNNPFAVTWLPYDLTDFTLTVHVNALADGGILLRGSGLGGGSPTGPPDAVVCILGGNGYGQGVRGGNAGTSSYWHVDGSGAVNIVNGVFTPGSDYDVTIMVAGNTYSIYVNGSATPVNTLTTSLNPHGYVGLYDDQPNTTTGSGFGPAMSYSNFTLVGTLYRPNLSIMPAGMSQATLLWPANTPGWTLQSNSSLTTTNWTAVTNSPVIVGTNFTVTVGNAVSQQFFRLQGKPE